MFNRYSENTKLNNARMMVVGECEINATEGASSKKALGTNLSGRCTTTGRTSGESVVFNATNGVTLMKNEVKLSGKRTEKGIERYVTFLCPFLCTKKVTSLYFTAFPNGSAGKEVSTSF